jgi:NADH-quinone oxidoreductase subunit J
MNDLLQNHLLDLAVLGAMLTFAVWAVLTARILRAVIALALASVTVAVSMFRLDAPLASAFELSVCAGLISAMFISVISLSKIDSKASLALRRTERLNRYWLLPLLLMVIGLMVFHVRIPEATELARGAGTDVRLVLWTERHLDLLGQVTVLLAGAFGVVVLFKELKKREH